MEQILEQVELQMAKFFNDELTILFADEHHSEPDARANLRRAKSAPVQGKLSVPLNHIFDTVYFGPSDYSRLLQAVDICTYFYMQSRFSKPANNPWARSQIKSICALWMIFCNSNTNGLLSEPTPTNREGILLRTTAARIATIS